MTKENQIKRIGLDKLNVLDQLNVILDGNFIIGGSISLLEYGIIDRPIYDIDIVVDSLDEIKIKFDQKGYEFQEWFDYDDALENQKDTIQERGKVTNRVSFVIDGINCCAFYGKNQKYRDVSFVADRAFKISDPKYAIAAKKKYIDDLLNRETYTYEQLDKLEKHASDYAAYHRCKLDMNIIELLEANNYKNKTK